MGRRSGRGDGETTASGDDGTGEARPQDPSQRATRRLPVAERRSGVVERLQERVRVAYVRLGPRRTLAAAAAVVVVAVLAPLAVGGDDAGPLGVSAGRFTATGTSVGEPVGVGLFVHRNDGDETAILQRVTVRQIGGMRFLGVRAARQAGVSSAWPPRVRTERLRGFRIRPGDSAPAIYVGVEFERPGRYVVAPRLTYRVGDDVYTVPTNRVTVRVREGAVRR